jgi:hypothetical protein
MSLRKQSLALLTGILLIVGQLMVVVHSVEHPFHKADALCAVYQHTEQHHMDVAVVKNVIETIFFQIQQVLVVQVADFSVFKYHYHPRAPPVS